jgi:20S proteasome alpha/beta subunit
VTLCIAAACQYINEPAIVLCCDERGTRGLVSADDSNKIRWVSDRMAVLLAGSRTHADQLFLSISENFAEHADLSDEIQITRFIQALKASAQKRKREMMSDYTAMNLGMNLDKFIKSSKSNMLESHYHDTWLELKSLHLV